MKTKQLILSVAVLTMAVSISFLGCRKPKEVKDTDSSSASDNSLAEKTSNDATNMAQEASEKGSMSSYRLGDENELTLSPCVSSIVRANQKITVIFNGQICYDGHVRNGSIVIDYSQSTPGDTFPRNPGFKCLVTTSNYTVDGMAVTINKTITNTTPNLNPGTNLIWSDNVSVSIVKSNGTVSWNGNKVVTLLNTSDTTVYRGQTKFIVWSKARIGVTGNATGTTAAGENFTANVTGQLVRDMQCSPTSHPGHHPFIDGTLDFPPGSKPTRHVDYGYPNHGACDNQALVTINTYTVAITLP